MRKDEAVADAKHRGHLLRFSGTVVKLHADQGVAVIEDPDEPSCQIECHLPTDMIDFQKGDRVTVHGRCVGMRGGRVKIEAGEVSRQ